MTRSADSLAHRPDLSTCFSDMTASESSASEGPAAGGSRVTSETGEVLAGRYRVGARIGSGSTGIVYRAEDLMFTRPVAVRLLTPALSREEDTIERLEARLHRNTHMLRDDVRALSDIVDIIDLGRTEGGQIFVVTELLPPESLADALAREGALGWRRLRPLAVRACQIVHLSHEHGLVRQDLQTRNLYPVRDKAQTGTLRVYSPGLGVAFGERLWSCLDPGEALLLARYAAPEQISNGLVDRRTDVYALGVILYECLTGQVPFSDPRPAHVLAAHLLSAPPAFPPDARRRGVSAELEAIVLRALAKAPDDRWPTVMALANAMAAIEFGPIDASGAIESGELNDFTDLLEPEPSATTMRIDRSRLSGRAGLVPAASATELALDPGLSASEMAWREILDAAESAVGAVVSAHERVDDTASDSAITRDSVTAGADLSDSTPTLAYGSAEHSAPRWPATTQPAALAPRRRVATWAVAASLALVTAAGVSYSLRPGAGQGPALAPTAQRSRPSAGSSSAPSSSAPSSPAPSSSATPANTLPRPTGVDTAPASVAAPPPVSALPPVGPPSAPPAPKTPSPVVTPPAAEAPPPTPTPAPFVPAPTAASPEPARPKPAPAPPRVRPVSRPAAQPEAPAPAPRKVAPGASLPDRNGHELPDPAAPIPQPGH